MRFKDLDYLVKENKMHYKFATLADVGTAITSGIGSGIGAITGGVKKVGGTGVDLAGKGIASVGGAVQTMLLGAPLIAGITLALVRKRALEPGKMETEEVQNNLVLAEYQEALGRVRRLKELELKKQNREKANASSAGNSIRELHI
jgi:hypothetical protein